MVEPGLTLSRYVADWLAHGLRAVHQRTAANYARSFRLHLLPLVGDTPIAQLTRPAIRAACMTLLDQGKGASVVRNAVIALSACLTAAVDDGLLAVNPARGALRRLLPRRGQTPVKSMTRDQTIRFLDAVPVVAPNHLDLFDVLFFAGLAIGEALGLERDDVDRHAAILRVRQQWIDGGTDIPKGGRVRSVQIDAALAERLRARADAMPGYRYLFEHPGKGVPWHPSSIRKIMREILRAAGLPLTFTPHSARHTLACRLLEETGDVAWLQRQLGHRRLETTVGLYARGAQLHRPDGLERLATLRAEPHPRLKRRVSGVT